LQYVLDQNQEKIDSKSLLGIFGVGDQDIVVEDYHQNNKGSSGGDEEGIRFEIFIEFEQTAQEVTVDYGRTLLDSFHH
jgi:hypothetical protein